MAERCDAGRNAPSLKELVNLPITDWHSLGLQLGVTYHQLKTIQANNAQYPDSLKRCVTDMFHTWLDNDLEPSNEKLGKALCAVGMPQLAHQFCRQQDAIQQVPISPTPRPPATTTSYPYKYSMVGIIIVLSCIAAGVLFIYNSTNRNHLAPQSPSSVTIASGDDVQNECTEACEKISCGHKTNVVAPNNLPHLPGPFVGRDEDLLYIVQVLLHSRNINTIHITGLPAVGKSTLAIHVGYEMARHGVAVRYINVDETEIFKNHEHSESHYQKSTSAPSQRRNDIELSWYSHTEEKYISTSMQGFIQWAKGLSNDTILIIDNCDPLLQNKATQKAFVTKLVSLNKASRYLRIVTTSRLKVSLVDGFKLYKLKPLDNESAIQLLQSVSGAMTLNSSRTVNELVGGIPLALKIVASLVSEIHPPDLIITELKQDLIETLTPEDVRPDMEKMRPVLKLSYKNLDTSTQECALYLSHFPGSFSHEAALHILNNRIHSSPVKCLTNLTDRSLLDPYSYADQLRYQFHKLIKEYLKDVESHKSRDETAAIFNLRFVAHYTQLLSSFSKRYNELPHDNDNIGRFEYESHNFKYILEEAHFICLWRFISIVNVTRVLTCDLMLETFTIGELLNATQRTLVMSECRNCEILAEKSASAADWLDVHHDLVQVIRKWIESSPAVYATWCKQSFLYPFEFDTTTWYYIVCHFVYFCIYRACAPIPVPVLVAHDLGTVTIILILLCVYWLVSWIHVILICGTLVTIILSSPPLFCLLLSCAKICIKIVCIVTCPFLILRRTAVVLVLLALVVCISIFTVDVEYYIVYFILCFRDKYDIIIITATVAFWVARKLLLCVLNWLKA